MKAKVIVERTNPYVTGVVLKDIYCIVTMDICCNRAWLCPDEHGRVKNVPKVGW